MDSAKQIRKDFSSKDEIFNYITQEFANENDLVLIRGSTAYGEIKPFSDVDVEIYSQKRDKPHYEIVFYKDNPVLLTIYFYIYEDAQHCEPPKNVKILQGVYNSKIESIFEEAIQQNDSYTNEKLITRKCQLILDFFFKYMRCRDEKYLDMVQKKLKFKK